jgi:hypothetical protein
MLSNSQDICDRSIRYERAISRPRLTRYCKLVIFSVPIVIKEQSNVDLIAGLYPLCPWWIGFPHSGVHMHLGCRRNRSTHSSHLLIACRRESRTYMGWAGVQVRLFSFCNCFSALSTNKRSEYSRFGTSCSLSSVRCPKSAARMRIGVNNRTI